MIGVGSMGQNHVRVLSEISHLVGVADVNVKVGAAVSNRFSVSYFMRYRDLFKEKPDAVVIAAPTDLHYEIASAALSAGIHVLVEKPICSTIVQAERLAKKAEELGLVLAVGHIERYNPVVGFAKKALQGKEYGQLITASTRRVSSLPERVRDVGVIMDLGIHDIDVLRYLVNSPVSSVYTLGGREKHERFEDHANILMHFENGVNGFVEVNWLTPIKIRQLSVELPRDSAVAIFRYLLKFLASYPKVREFLSPKELERLKGRLLPPDQEARIDVAVKDFISQLGGNA